MLDEAQSSPLAYDPTRWVDRPPYSAYEETPAEALATQDEYDSLVRGLQQRLAAAAGPAGADGSNPANPRTVQFISTEGLRHGDDNVVLYESSGAHKFSNAQRSPLAGMIGITLQREDTMTITEHQIELV